MGTPRRGPPTLHVPEGSGRGFLSQLGAAGCTPTAGYSSRRWEGCAKRGLTKLFSWGQLASVKQCYCDTKILGEKDPCVSFCKLSFLSPFKSVQCDPLSTSLHFRDGNSSALSKQLRLREKRSGLPFIVALQSLGNHLLQSLPTLLSQNCG